MHLCAVPVLLDGYTPDLGGLPVFLLRLATEVRVIERRDCVCVCVCVVLCLLRSVASFVLMSWFVCTCN